MKRAILIAATLALILGAGGQAKADLLYDNGPINGTIDAWTINYGFQVSNSFTLTQSDQLTGVQFGAWEFRGDKLNTVDWTISTGPLGGGVVAGSGTATVTDTPLYSNVYGYEIDQINFPLNLSLPAGTYYLTLQNGSNSSGDPVYWDQNNGPSTAYESAFGLLNGNPNVNPPGGSESFQIYGSPIPEPASLTVFGVATLAGAAFCGWRRRKQPAQA